MRSEIPPEWWQLRLAMSEISPDHEFNPTNMVASLKMSSLKKLLVYSMMSTSSAMVLDKTFSRRFLLLGTDAVCG